MDEDKFHLACVDVETFGMKPGALVVQAGAVLFEGDIAEGTYKAVRWNFWNLTKDQPLHSMPVSYQNAVHAKLLDSDTICWHLSARCTPSMVGDLLTAPGLDWGDIGMFCADLKDWNQEYKPYWCAQNNEFDFSILEPYVPGPGKFYDFRKTLDIRCLTNLGLITKEELSKVKTHNALDDAYGEGKLACEAFILARNLIKQLRSPK